MSNSADQTLNASSIPAQLNDQPKASTPPVASKPFSFATARAKAQEHVKKSIPVQRSSDVPYVPTRPQAVKPVARTPVAPAPASITPQSPSVLRPLQAGSVPLRAPAPAASIPAQKASTGMGFGTSSGTSSSSGSGFGFSSASSNGRAPGAGSAGIPAMTPSAPAVAPAGVLMSTATGAGFTFGASAARVDPVAQAMKAVAPDVLYGTLIDLRMYNDWGLGKVTDQITGRKVSIKGAALAGLQIGLRYKFDGKKSSHEKYGLQFEVHQVSPDVESIEALISHIQRNYKNVGHVTAKKLAEHYRDTGRLEELKNILIHHPASMDFSAFTDKPVTLRDDEESQGRRVRDSLSIRFGGMGIAQGVMQELSKWLIGRAQIMIGTNERKGKDLVSVSNEILEENPYKPMEHVERYGFQTADLVASRVGINKKDPKRIAAIVSYALNEGCNAGGHMFLHEEALFESIRRFDSSIEPKAAIALALEREEPIVIDGNFGRARYYTKGLRRAESNLADQLAMRMTTEIKPLCDLVGEELERVIDQAVANVGNAKGNPKFKLDNSQREALSGILTSTCSLHTLTAGPGCGKTAIVEVMMEVLGLTKQQRTTFCAPIGKAAKVLSSRVKNWGVAKTIHSTLEFKGHFERNIDNPLETDLVVADEQSMLGGPLGAAFLDAIPPNAHVLMLGDPGQLGAIEPGQVLKSVLKIEGFDHHRLTETHRNSGAILEFVKMVADGMWPTNADHVRDLLSRGDVKLEGSLPAPTEGAFSQLALEVKQAAQDHGGLEKVGVICPVRRGNTTTPGWNVTYLNAVLREALNPDPDETKKITGCGMRLNDRVIVCKNMTIPLISDDGDTAYVAPEPDQKAPSRPVFDEHGDEIDAMFSEMDDDSDEDDENKTYVVNGDTGWLEDVEYKVKGGAKQPHKLTLRLDDGRRVSFPAADLSELNLAYAITVHAAQGSEYSNTFNIVTPGHEQFMHRSLLMTMLSRAQNNMKIIGDISTLVQVSARKPPRRNCGLVERVMREAGEIIGERIEEEQNEARSFSRDRQVA